MWIGDILGFSLFLLWLFGIQSDEQERRNLSYFLNLQWEFLQINRKVKMETEDWNMHQVCFKFHLRYYKRDLPREWYQTQVLSSYLLFNDYILLYDKLPITQFVYCSAYQEWNCKSHLNMVMMIFSSVFSPSFTRKKELL